MYIWKQRQYTRTKQNSKEEIYTNTLDGYGVHKLLNMSFGLKKSSAQSFAKQQCCSIAWVVKKKSTATTQSPTKFQLSTMEACISSYIDSPCMEATTYINSALVPIILTQVYNHLYFQAFSTTKSNKSIHLESCLFH